VVQAVLESERQLKEEAKQAYTDMVNKNEELIKKLGEAEKKTNQLQEAMQRSVRKPSEGFVILLIWLLMQRLSPKLAPVFFPFPVFPFFCFFF